MAEVKSRAFNQVSRIITPQEVERLLAVEAGTPAFHHDDPGHKVGTTLVLPFLASWLNRRLAGTFDVHFKRYDFSPGSGGVPAHTDMDLDGFDMSALIFLRTSYQGAATWFSDDGRVLRSPHPTEGDVLLFPHNVRHWADPVESGTKIVLKGDWRSQQETT